MGIKRGKRKPSRGLSPIPAEILADERFQDVVTDPKFRPIPKKEATVGIDRRFRAMFTDRRFKIKGSLDKRGRPLNTTSAEDLKRFYRLDEPDDSAHCVSNVKKKSANVVRNLQCPERQKAETLNLDSLSPESSETHSKVEEEEKNLLKSRPSSPNIANSSDDDVASSEDGEDSDRLLDLARGEGNVETSESDSTDSSEDEAERLARDEAAQEVEWNEMDRDALRSEDISPRLAVCNMDWNNVKAVDLFVLLNSFVPVKGNGAIKSVSIYPSEFGKERMLVEAQHGPKLSSKGDQAIRKYEFDRLRYYYAVVVCDSSTTANSIYESCDGLEYQTSGTKLDLRFIPDSMEFSDEERSDYCSSLPLEYEPLNFVNSALMLSKCDSTWDDCDARRRRALTKIYPSKNTKGRRKSGAQKIDDFDQMAQDLRTYIASSSSAGDSSANDSDIDENRKQARISKYRKLLETCEPSSDKESARSASEDQSTDEQSMHTDDGDREMTFSLGLRDAVNRKRKEKDDSEKAVKKRTPFQEYLERKKQKKRERRLAERAKRARNVQNSDDDLPEDIKNDPFFKQNAREAKQSRSDSCDTVEDDGKGDRERQELELLLLDDENDTTGKRHFSLKKIIQDEKQTSRKNRGRMTAQAVNLKGATDDEFQINLDDPRFAAIYTDHRFNIDPSHHAFKKTKAINSILIEKARRSKVADLQAQRHD